MANVILSGTLANAPTPFDALQVVARISGTATSTVLNVGIAQTVVILDGVGLTYDALALPAGGTITGIRLVRLPVDLVWSATGFSVTAADFRANAQDLDAFLFGGADVLTGGSTSDHAHGYGGDDSISTGTGNDGIVAGEGNDTVRPGGNTDGIDLGAGDDLLVIGDAQNLGLKYADGGTGSDTVLGSGDLAANATLQNFESLAWQVSSTAIRLTGAQLAGFTTLHLGSSLLLNETAELEITGGGFVDLGAPSVFTVGADSLDVTVIGPVGTMLRGRDTGQAGSDDDITLTGTGADSIATFGGNDTITATGAAGAVAAGEGNDRVTVVLGANLLLLEAGADTATGGSGADTIDGGIGFDLLDGGTGNDAIAGDDGNDTILGGLGSDTIFAGEGNDSVRGGAVLGDFDSVYGEAGNDTLQGGGGLGTGALLSGGAGDDSVVAGGQVNSLFGDEGNDTLTGSSVVLLPGGVGATTVGNSLRGGADQDLLNGRSGRDLLDGGTGADTLVGGGGSDTYVIDSLLDVIQDSGNDELLLPAGDLVQSAVSFTLTATLEHLTLTQAGRTGTGNTGANTIIGSLGFDTILGLGGNDSISGGGGDDSLVGNGGVVVGGSEADTIRGGLGNDVIEAGGTFATPWLYGDGGDDTLTSTGLSSRLEGGADNDVLIGSSQSFGTGGTVIFAADDLFGGTGNDSLYGARGADELTGGTGADTFGYAAGDSGQVVLGSLAAFDTITDFNRAEGDRIDLSAIDADLLLAGNQAFDEVLPVGSPVPITAGSLRYTVGAGATTIDASVDSDTAPELRIVVSVAGYTPILADFIL
ncbi:calcium-binding protein [Roseomonas sp. CECT 9278]|uniref:beta strand repeat-containing protein n=1 Tax=Roseomonas sp. CECT 9278 TaxID=2845823 RepID=UPI001E2B6896|nr:calcium-binding protein [Roseomonas sp. CECT 9278]CAH0154455.1 hypothetical protein ROS9278_00804 [Roseomonas sp. CECT 9278]